MSSNRPRVTLYGRPGCHLCDEAREAIIALGAELGPIEMLEIDIESDDRLLTDYLERIPVVELEGREVSELELDPDSFAASLRELHTVRP